MAHEEGEAEVNTNQDTIQEFCPLFLVFQGWTLSHLALEGVIEDTSSL